MDLEKTREKRDIGSKAKESISGIIRKWRESKHIDQPTKAEQVLVTFENHYQEIVRIDDFKELFDSEDMPASFRACVCRINKEIRPAGLRIRHVSGWELVKVEDEEQASE